MCHRDDGVTVAHGGARGARLLEPAQVVGGELDLVFVAAGLCAQVAQLKLALHGVDIEAKLAAGG